jgi:alpha-L-rhamnosidase
MMGAIDDWSHRNLAGVRPTAPGFARFVVAPLVPERLGYVEERWESPYGTIEADWRKRGDRLEQDVTVPVNTTAEIRVPTSGPSRVTVDGRLVWDGRAGRAHGAHAEGDRIVLQDLGGGRYEIESEPLEHR